MSTKARIEGRICKVEAQEDGTLIVEGIASAPVPDSDGETFTTECMKAAIPDYMAKRRALREMHQPIAAGTTQALWIDEEGRTRIRAHVVDPVTVKKVETDVLKMFSIEGVIPPGGRDAKNRKIVHKLKLREISLVDVGANPEALVEAVIAKLDGPALEEEPDMSGTTEEQTTPETTPTDEVTKAEGTTPTREDVVKKWAGEEISDARRAIECLDALFYLFQKESAEGEGAQAADLKTVCDRLRAFISAEILEDNATPKPGEPVALADGAHEGDDNVAKKGAKFSKATKAALKGAFEALKGLNFDDMPEDEDEPKKVEGGNGEEDAVAKACKLEDAVAKLEGEKAELAAQVATQAETIQKAEADLAAVVEQMKVKGYLKAIDKAGDDTAAKSQTPEGGDTADTTDPLDAIRKVHRAGGTVVNNRARD